MGLKSEMAKIARLSKKAKLVKASGAKSWV